MPRLFWHIRHTFSFIAGSWRSAVLRARMATRSHMDVQAFRSKQTVVTIKADGHRHKIIQVLFSKDGSLYVTFPYFKHAEGLLAVVTVTRPPGTTSEINLADTGKVASHLVKYSHHPDGRAHFSQDGKVRTEIRRQAVALEVSVAS